jgi:homoaconitase/3-isopropylmalate dehydratase large subunit
MVRDPQAPAAQLLKDLLGRGSLAEHHAVPAPSIRDAEAGKKASAFAAEHGIGRLFDIGRHGIVHQVVAEQGLAQPGMVIACSDSHTCAAGAFGAAACGLGPVEMLQIVCTGRTWYEVLRGCGRARRTLTDRLQRERVVTR